MRASTPLSRDYSSQTLHPLQAKNQRRASPRERAVLVLLLLGFAVLALMCRNPFMGQWDSFDYVTKAVRHQVSDLAFGRPLFLGILRVAWEGAHLLGVGIDHAFQVAQSIVWGFGICGLVCFYFCVKWVGGVRLGLWGVAWLGTTPMYLAYSGMVMTEVPSLTCLLAAVALLLHWERSRKLSQLVGSALLFAAGIHIREQLITAAALFPLIIFLDRGLTGRRRVSAVLVHTGIYTLVVLAMVAFLVRMDPDFWGRVQGWAAVLPIRTHGLGKQFLYLLAFAIVNGGVSLVGMLLTWRKWAKVAPVRALVSGMALLPLLTLLPNADLRIQPRYELLAVPAFILAALVGLRMMQGEERPPTRKILVGVVLVGHLAFFAGGMAALVRFNRLSLERKARVETLLVIAPQNAGFVGGAYTPILDFYQQSGIRPGWEVIRSGWEWNRESLPERINRELMANRRIYYLSDAGVWDYLREEQADVEALRSKFRFIRVDRGMERIEWDYR
ncbi:MAG: glycosyltransferase family 39 protein [Acidobacteriia bacterium]|nr:glycosyltransferase family 39 protein [Terriglobia bacterium]